MITIVVEGGLVQQVYSTSPEEVRIIDLDVEGNDPDEDRIQTITKDGKEVLAWVSYEQSFKDEGQIVD